MIIDNVSDRYYGNYTLRADNLIGSSMAVIQLVPIVISTSTSLPDTVYRLEMKQQGSSVVSGHRQRSATIITGHGVRNTSKRRFLQHASSISNTSHYAMDWSRFMTRTLQILP